MDRKTLSEQNETPEDVATLYSWANLHGARYRDFSAARAQTREKTRQRMIEAINGVGEASVEDEEAQRAAEARRAAELARAAEAERQAEYAAQRSVQQPMPQNVWQPQLPSRFAPAAPSENATQPPQPAAITQQPEPRGFASMQASLSGIRTTLPPNLATSSTPREDARARTTLSGLREDVSRPAWLAAPQPEMTSQPVPRAPEDTLQASRDRMTARWFALKGVFDVNAQPPTPETATASVPSRPPAMAVFSLAGGVGKTSLVATMARALAARGERVLLVDTAEFGLLPFFFGARDHRPGVLRTFSPPGSSGDAPVQLVGIDPASLSPETANHEALTEEITRHARGSNRILIDLPTASASMARRVLRMAPTVLIPVIPDMTSVVSIGSLEAFFRHHPGPSGRPIQPFYLLNQFDHSLPLHLDVREVLREQVGERLLPFAVRRSPALSEALAEGMTVIDYAPNSTAAEDFVSLAGWIKTIAAPVSSSYRGVRWSER